jgi:glycosyltransferase involved in cell wall biosynthesis
VEVVAAGPGAARVDGFAVERVDGRGLFYGGGAPDALAARGTRGALAWARAARFQAALAAAVRRRAAGWDAAVSHWLVPSSLAVALALAARRGQARHLAIAHSSDAWILRRSKAGRRLMRWLAARADLVYTGAHLAVDGAPGRVVPMGIDAAALRGDRERGRARFSLHRTTALFLGRLVPIKRLELVLEALPDGLDLLVAGDGPMRTAWQRLAPPRVRFLGEVRGAAKRDLLAACDLLVFSSRPLRDQRDEGSPTVVLEALAAGLPVVATRAGALPALLHDGTDALLVDGASSLRAALERLASDPALRHRLADAGRRLGWAHDWARIGPILAATLLEERRNS